ncbi:MAG: GGDEF domain-containing protein [Bacilli bacterium]
MKTKEVATSAYRLCIFNLVHMREYTFSRRKIDEAKFVALQAKLEGQEQQQNLLIAYASIIEAMCDFKDSLFGEAYSTFKGIQHLKETLEMQDKDMAIFYRTFSLLSKLRMDATLFNKEEISELENVLEKERKYEWFVSLIFTLMHSNAHQYSESEITSKLKKCEDVIRKIDNERCGEYFNQVGLIYRFALKAPIHSLHYFIAALESSRRFQNKDIEASTLYYIASDYYEIYGQKEEAIRFLKPIVEMFPTRDTLFKCTSLSDLCQISLEVNDYESAKYYLEQYSISLAKVELPTGVKEQFVADFAVKHVWVDLFTNTAEEILLERLTISEGLYKKNSNRFNFHAFDLLLLQTKGKIAFVNEKFEEAEKYFYEALALANQYNRSKYVVDTLCLLLDAQTRLSNTQTAYATCKQYVTKYREWQETETYEHYNHMHQYQVARINHEQISMFKQKNNELERLNFVDNLTNLKNRRYYDLYLQRLFIKKDLLQIGVAMVDIDQFKLYNDTFGHLSGDDVLKKVAQCFLARFNRTTDTVIRYGGEEFLILSKENSSTVFEERLQLLSEDIVSAAIQHSSEAMYPYVTISIGAVFSERGIVVDDMPIILEEADKNLYKAKKEGRNTIRFITL